MRPPDRKQRELAQHYRDRIAGDLFDERDVAGLLTTLRCVPPPNPIIFELGSFLAHRPRTKGAFHRFFTQGVQAARTEEGLRLGMNADPIYSATAILDAANRSLTALAVEPIDAQNADGMALCVISLLQDVTFENETDATELGRIFLAANDAEIFAMAAVRVGARAEQIVPVLRVPNRWLKLTPPAGQAEEGVLLLAMPNAWVTVVRSGDDLAVISH